MSKKNKNKDGKKAEVEFVAPDGGWGWVIVVAAGVSYICVIPLIQSFGLIFLDRFHELNFSSTDITLIITFNSWFGMVIGIFYAPLMKRFGFRKMAFAGVTIFQVGFFCTGFATERYHFLLSYGLVASVGFTLLMQSFSFAINTYFKKRRSFAAGRSSFITAIGPIVMPILISFLLKTYGVKWTVFLLSAINLHAYVGACLLQPVKWHVKKPKPELKIITEETDPEDEEIIQTPVECDTYSLFGGLASSSFAGSKRSLNRRLSGISFNRRPSNFSFNRQSGISWQSQDSLTRIQKQRLDSYKKSVSESEGIKKGKSITKLDSEDYEDMMRSMLYLLEKPTEKSNLLEEPKDCEKSEGDLKLLASVESLNLNDVNDFQTPEQRKLISISSIDEAYSKELESTSDDSKSITEKKKKRPWWQRLWRYIKKLYDLDLLTDPIYINITIGMSIAIIGEMIFSLLTPFILDDVGLDLDQKAYFMSVVAFTDLAFRYIAPYVGARLKFGSRAMYVTALFLLLITRACMFLPSTFEGYLAVAAGLGIGKGFRTVFWGLVIPDYVPLPKYPSASAIQMLANGILLALSGPIIGAIVSISKSYTHTIIMSNVLTLITVIMWYTEFAIVWFRDRRKSKEDKKAELENK